MKNVKDHNGPETFSKSYKTKNLKQYSQLA